MGEEDWAELGTTLTRYIIWGLASLGDAAFLASWVAVQWLMTKHVYHPLSLSGMDRVTLWVFQVLFTISTLAPVALAIYSDVTLAVVRTQRVIRREIRRAENDEQD